MFRPSRAPATWTLLIGVTIVFLIELIVGAVPRSFRLEATPQADAVLRQLGAIIPGMLATGDNRRLIVAMFLHGNLLHWATNSIALLQLGSIYESLFGSARFIGIYFATGLVASLASAMYQHAPSVGASGAIFGLLGALIFSVLRSPRYRTEPWARSLVKQLLFWIVLNLAIGFYFPFIDNIAHMGGLFSGLLLGFLPHRVPPPPPADVVINVVA